MIPPTTKETPLGLAEMQGWFEPSGKQENRNETHVSVASIQGAIADGGSSSISVKIVPACTPASTQRSASDQDGVA